MADEKPLRSAPISAENDVSKYSTHFLQIRLCEFILLMGFEKNDTILLRASYNSGYPKA